MIDRRATAAHPPPSFVMPIHRFTCLRCGRAFVCERPTTVDSSWNRYASHSYVCKGTGPDDYEHDMIDPRPFNPIRPQPVWSPYP